MDADQVNQQHRLRFWRRLLRLVYSGTIALCVGAGVGVGVAEHSIGWGLLAAFATAVLGLMEVLTWALAKGGKPGARIVWRIGTGGRFSSERADNSKP
jgi:hypothetical protein